MTSRCPKNSSTKVCLYNEDNFVGKRALNSDHPKKNALKRQLRDLEQERVIVQPIQPDQQIAKRLKSDWDLLFYNKDDANPNKLEGNRLLDERHGLINEHLQLAAPKAKKRLSFLVKGREMKSFFHLTGRQ